MSKVLEKATAHFRNVISGDLKKVTVPEWECDIYFKPATTLKEESKLIELAQQGKTVEALVESLIIRARNSDGTKMFTQLDRQVFMNEIDPNIIIRIVGEMNTSSANIEKVEDAEKN
jgi:hypothetical protein